jgi:hypothetical protein
MLQAPFDWAGECSDELQKRWKGFVDLFPGSEPVVPVLPKYICQWWVRRPDDRKLRQETWDMIYLQVDISEGGRQ